MSVLPSPAQRAQITAQIQAETGIDEAMIKLLVESFYAKVRQDAVIGPIFEARVADWGPHLRKMRDFWSSVALMTGDYHGQPMQKHMVLPIDARHFDRWLALFEATAAEQCPPAAAAHFIDRARRIAESLELGVASGHGVMPRRGQRYYRDAADSDR